MKKLNLTNIFILASLMILVSCSSKEAKSTDKLSGTVKVDGSSTVFPITEAVAEEFGKVHPKVRVTVGISGTGGGFKKFCTGETDINDASRLIKGKEEKKAKENNIEYIELPVAYDGLSVVVSNDNDWVDYLTVEELNAIWMPDSKVSTWQDVRPNWPNQKIKLFGPGTDSGTFDYFTDVINGKSQVCRHDFTKSEDDNVLVQGVAGSKYSLGFFGFAYYKENSDKIKAVAIDGGSGGVLPTEVTINDGSYSPLSRPIFIYVSKASTQKPHVDAFVNYYLNNASSLVTEVGYIPLPDNLLNEAKRKYQSRITGKWN